MTPEEIEAQLKVNLQTLRHEMVSGFQQVEARFLQMEARFNQIDSQFNRLKILIWLPIITAGIQVFVALHK
jgi:hypothetical protein